MCDEQEEALINEIQAELLILELSMPAEVRQRLAEARRVACSYSQPSDLAQTDAENQ